MWWNVAESFQEDVPEHFPLLSRVNVDISFMWTDAFSRRERGLPVLRVTGVSSLQMKTTAC